MRYDRRVDIAHVSLDYDWNPACYDFLRADVQKKQPLILGVKKTGLGALNSPFQWLRSKHPVMDFFEVKRLESGNHFQQRMGGHSSYVCSGSGEDGP